jgi:uncharacterized protein
MRLSAAKDFTSRHLSDGCKRGEAGMTPSFEWDKAKAAANEKKHSVDFEEAATVFADSLAAIFPDPDHSNDETREIIVGHSDRNRLLVVSFTERGDAIRIISARAATKRERKKYEDSPMGGWDHE